MRERIIEETTKMFITYGLKSIRMDDIASNLGISKRTIYEIFGDKENLILECMRYYSVYIEDRKKAKLATAGNVIEEFLLLLEDWDNEMETNYKLMSNVMKFYPNIYRKIFEENSKKGYATLRQKLVEGVEKGLLLDNIDCDLAISVFSYSIFGIVYKRNDVLPNNVSDKDAFRYVITYFFRGIATEKGIKMIDDYIEKENQKNKDRKNMQTR